MNSEPYALRTTVGLEVTSNDRRLKYIVRKTTSFDSGIEHDFYVSYCYVKDGDGWVRTDTVGTYNDEAEFTDTLVHSAEFTRALAELKS